MSQPAPRRTVAPPGADAWLTLAQAFLPPVQPPVAQAFLDDLAGDLHALLVDTALVPATEVEAFHNAVAAIDGPGTLLLHYSNLFLAPPVKARLNLGVYVDGALGGDSQDLIGRVLSRHGLRPRGDFPDLADHVTLLLESLAWLTGENDSGGDFNALACDILFTGLSRLERDIALHAPQSPYRALTRIAQFALDHVADRHDRCTPVRGALPAAGGIWRSCRRCGRSFAREKELAVMTRALAENGLPADHLQFCPRCRRPDVDTFTRAAEPA